MNADLLSTIAIYCTALENMRFFGMIESAAGLVEIVKSCRALQNLQYVNMGNTFDLTRSEVEAIASLPRLEELIILGIDMEEGALSALNRCRSLRFLIVRGKYDEASVRAEIDTHRIALLMYEG